jgi:hypothetical protein
MQCLYAIGEKRRVRNQKLCVALVTPGSSAWVKYRHGVALVSSFSRDMWVPLWVTGGRITWDVFLCPYIWFKCIGSWLYSRLQTLIMTSFTVFKLSGDQGRLLGSTPGRFGVLFKHWDERYSKTQNVQGSIQSLWLDCNMYSAVYRNLSTVLLKHFDFFKDDFDWTVFRHWIEMNLILDSVCSDLQPVRTRNRTEPAKTITVSVLFYGAS